MKTAYKTFLPLPEILRPDPRDSRMTMKRRFIVMITIIGRVILAKGCYCYFLGNRY